MCELIDIAEAVRLCNGLGNDNLVLLQCGSLYPLPPEQANLRVLESFRSSFGTALGFSDHTLGNAAAAAAVALGARVFEKHFTLDRSMKGPDHSYALEPAELKAYVQTVSDARSEEHTSELQSLMRNSSAVFCLNKKQNKKLLNVHQQHEHSTARHTHIY